MTWSKFSDDFTDDCWILTDAAYRLHTDGIIWSNRKLLDLCIPKEDVARFAKRPDAVMELLEQGFWVDVGSAYVIRHHAQYQRSREAVIKQQEVNRENGGKGGRPKGKAREQVQDVTYVETHSLSESETESLGESKTEGITGVSETAPKLPRNQGTKTPDIPRGKTQSRIEPASGSETERDRTGSIEGSSKNPTSSEKTIDPGYPSDPKAIGWRKQIEAAGITSEAQLATDPQLTPNMARRMWRAAFPGSSAA